MERKQVSSSNLSSVGYNEKESILEIEFNHGGVYQYFDVPVEEYNGIISASSHGKYFHANIKDCYNYSKVY